MESQVLEYGLKTKLAWEIKGITQKIGKLFSKKKENPEEEIVKFIEPQLSELDIFKRGKSIIESCTTPAHVEYALDYIDLIRNVNIEAYDSLQFLIKIKIEELNNEETNFKKENEKS